MYYFVYYPLKTVFNRKIGYSLLCGYAIGNYNNRIELRDGRSHRIRIYNPRWFYRDETLRSAFNGFAVFDKETFKSNKHNYIFAAGNRALKREAFEVIEADSISFYVDNVFKWHGNAGRMFLELRVSKYNITTNAVSISKNLTLFPYSHQGCDIFKNPRSATAYLKKRFVGIDPVTRFGY